jgi:hypothetical protein
MASDPGPPTSRVTVLFSVEAYFPRIPLERARETFKFRAPGWLAVSLMAITPVGKLAIYSRLVI